MTGMKRTFAISVLLVAVLTGCGSPDTLPVGGRFVTPPPGGMPTVKRPHASECCGDTVGAICRPENWDQRPGTVILATVLWQQRIPNLHRANCARRIHRDGRPTGSSRNAQRHVQDAASALDGQGRNESAHGLFENESGRRSAAPGQ